MPNTPLSFEASQAQRRSPTLGLGSDDLKNNAFNIPQAFLRRTPAQLPELSELQVIRHFTALSYKNFAIDKQMYPLGSCTMKYNPRAAHRLASLPGFLQRHPLADLDHSQGILGCLWELQEYLKAITGMSGVSLSPMAGAQGELAGVLMIRAYHQSRGDFDRNEILVPDSAHGTNPASAVMAGFKIRELATDAHGDLNLENLRSALGPKTAGIMLTNPSTLGLFERKIETIANLVHEAGGLLYYDGANLNAIMGRTRPGDMGFDVMHMNLHKTFATPHGGGGPGSGPVAANAKLSPFLPSPLVIKNSGGDHKYQWHSPSQSIGRLSAFMGNTGILLRAYIYIRLLGRTGLTQVSELACLNAHYLLQGFKKLGMIAAYPKRMASHEFVVTFKQVLKEKGISALDIAKRLLDFGIHAPTVYFPLSVPECWLVEPTETESKQDLDRLIAALQSILVEVDKNPEILHNAPHTLPVRRLDEVKAAKDLDIKYY
ncbi:MAG: aminomethyl-transferring glycine dehydrogenase subunit GcvPB [Gammaproteobacteria bacterium]